MVNNYFAVKVVSEDRDRLDRLHDIMLGRVNECIPCHIDEVEMPYDIFEEDGLYVLMAYGNIQVSFEDCILKEKEVVKQLIGFVPLENGLWDMTRPVYSTLVKTDLLTICDELDLHMEVYTQDEADTVVEHVFIDPEGAYSYDTMTPSAVLNISLRDLGAIDKLNEAFAFNTASDIIQ